MIFKLRLEADLNYPDELHELHHDCPLVGK